MHLSDGLAIDLQLPATPSDFVEAETLREGRADIPALQIEIALRLCCRDLQLLAQPARRARMSLNVVLLFVLETSAA